MLLLLITLFLHYDLFSCVIDEKANFNETALMKQHHENYIQVKTFIKDAQRKFQDNTPTRIDHQLETTRDTQSTDFRSWLWGNPSSGNPSNENFPYLPFGRSRPTFPDEITPFTPQTNEHHLKWDEIFPNQKSKTNEPSFGIDFEKTAPNNTNPQLSRVSLMNSKDRKGFKTGEFEMEVNSYPKKEILKLSDPIESKLHFDNAHPSTVKPSSNLHLSSKVPIDQKRFHPNESKSLFVHPEFYLRRPMSDIQLPSKKYAVDSHQNHVASETGQFKNRITTENNSRFRNTSSPSLKTSTSSIKYQYRFNPLLQTKEFILLVRPVPVTAKSSSPESLKRYPKTKNSFNPILKAKGIILRHPSQTTTKAKVSSKTLKPSPKTLQSYGLKKKSSIAKTFKSFKPKTIKAFTKALKFSNAKNLMFTNPKILKPLSKKIQSMEPHNCSRPPRRKPNFRPKNLLRGHSGEGFKLNTSLTRPNEEHKKIRLQDFTTYNMPVDNWVLTLVEKIGLTTRKSFRTNPTRNFEGNFIKPHALVSSNQLKNTPKNQVVHFLRQGPPRTRTTTEDHILSTTTAEYEDYSLPTMPNNIEDHRLSTPITEDYRVPTIPANIEDATLSTTTKEVEDYSLPTTPTNVRHYRPSTTATEYEDYSLPTTPTNTENYKLSTTTKEVEDYSLPTTSTKVEDHTLSTTVTDKPRFTIENHGGILHLITIPGGDEDTTRVGRPGFIVDDEEMMEPLTTVDVMYRGPEMISTRDGMYGAQNLAAQKIDKTRRHLKEKKKKRQSHHKHNTRQRKHKHRHRKNRKKYYKKQKKHEMEYPLLFTDLRKRQKTGETNPLKAIPELSHNETINEKVFRLMETQDKTPVIDNKNLYNKVKETLKQAQIKKEIERQKKKVQLIRRIAEGSSYSDEEESLKRNLVQALQYGNKTSK